MNNLQLLITKNGFKKLSLLFFPLSLICLWILVEAVFDMGDIKGDRSFFGGIGILLTIFIREIIQPIIILVFALQYMKNKNLFFIFYFLFFIFYFLFFIISEQLTISSAAIYVLVIDPLSFIFVFIFFIYIFKWKKKILRYFFAFLTAISHIILNLYVLKDNGNIIDNITFMIFHENTKFYQLHLYTIPLAFALIQLFIEAYHFYQKEKPKWMRYNRMKEYKENKNNE